MTRDTLYYYFMHKLEEHQGERSAMLQRTDLPQDIRDCIAQAMSDVNEMLQRILNLEDELENGGLTPAQITMPDKPVHP